MEENVKRAMDDISLIKHVIIQTQKDFSVFSSFFIWIGGINFINWVLEYSLYFMRRVIGYNSLYYIVCSKIIQFFLVISYIVCYTYCYKCKRNSLNFWGSKMIKIWGGILIGSQFFSFLYVNMIAQNNSDVVNVLWRCKELMIIVPVFIALFMTGILAERRIITVVTAIISLLYIAMFTSMKNINFSILGYTKQLSISSILINVIMTLGMVLLGMYLRKEEETDGNKFDT